MKKPNLESQIPWFFKLLAGSSVGRLFRAALFVSIVLAGGTPLRLQAWGAMHGSITQSALSVLPAWQQDLLGDQKAPMINLYCMIPDLAQAPAYKKDFNRFVVLPNGDLFCHLPFKTRDKNVYQIKYYIEQTVAAVRENKIEEGAHWAGCLLHFLEDSGSPAHAMQGDNQMGLMKDLLPTPEAFQYQPMHGLIEEGKLWINISGYQPQLLGTTPEEAASNLIERYNAMVRNARAQIIPIIQATYKGSQEEINAGQMRAATMDAQVVADALYTMFSIAKEHFNPEETARLNAVDMSSLTPVEVIDESYFPQFTYFSDPYFGFPVRNGILDGDKKKQPLALNVARDGIESVQEFKHGLGLGTGCQLTYALPNKVYDQFDCLVGLHATLGKEGKVVFRVFADDKQVFESAVMTGETPAQKVSLPIWGVKEIAIVTESRSKERGHNFAVIAEPTLRKTKDPQKLKEAEEAARSMPATPSEEQLKNPTRIKTE